MEIFSQNKLLKSIILVLILLNLTVIGVYQFKSRGDGRKPPKVERNDKRDVSSVLEKELNLTDAQSEKINQLRRKFFEREKGLSDSIRSLRDSLNIIMFGKNTDTTVTVRIARNIAGHEYTMEMLRIEQAQEFKKICTPAQVEKFSDLVREIRDYFRPEINPPPNDKQNRKRD